MQLIRNRNKVDSLESLALHCCKKAVIKSTCKSLQNAPSEPDNLKKISQLNTENTDWDIVTKILVELIA